MFESGWLLRTGPNLKRSPNSHWIRECRYEAEIFVQATLGRQGLGLKSPIEEPL